MNLKIIFGIIFPVIFIIILALLGSWPEGFSVKKNFEQSINASEIFKNGYSNNAFRIGELRIENAYFLPKRYDAPAYLVCVYDKDSVRPLQQAGSVFYNEGEYSKEVEILDLATASRSIGYYDPYYYGNRNYKTNIEIGANKEKKLQVYYSSSRNYYNYNQQAGTDRDYDYLILIEQKQSKQATCEGLSSEELQNAVKITINQPEFYCFDSDDADINNQDYYSIRNRLSILGSCNDNSGASSSDYCQDSENVIEYSCAASANQKCSTSVYDCKAYGFRSCSNGVCVI